MESCRIYNCARCHIQVVICSHCDHGNVYCSGGCAEISRRESVRKAGARYQGNKKKGAKKHAARMERYRERLRNSKKVTHQGSASLSQDDLLSANSEPLSETVNPTPSARTSITFSADRCHFCGKRCTKCLRNRFLGGRRVPTVNKRK